MTFATPQSLVLPSISNALTIKLSVRAETGELDGPASPVCSNQNLSERGGLELTACVGSRPHETAKASSTKHGNRTAKATNRLTSLAIHFMGHPAWLDRIQNTTSPRVAEQDGCASELAAK